MITWQDYEKAEDKIKWIGSAITTYRSSAEYKKAVMEEEYMAGNNRGIRETLKVIYDSTGTPMPDITASNIRISSMTLHRRVSQRCAYSLGNGISFKYHIEETVNGKGMRLRVDTTKHALGTEFDQGIYDICYWGGANGEAYIFVHKGYDDERWQYDVFRKTEFLTLYDEETGALRGGIRFWSLDWQKRPVTAVLYTQEGYTKYRTLPGKYGVNKMQEVEPLRAYTETVAESEADGETVIGTGAYSTLPIFVFRWNKFGTSALDNLKPKIDSKDLILSGYANDLADVAQIYWAVSGAGGMSKAELEQLRDQIMLMHIAQVDGEHSKVDPVSVEIPYEARAKCLELLDKQIYEDFGALDVHTIQAGATNDHIDAAYQPMDEEADDFEYQVTKLIKQILSMLGIEDEPQYKRNRVSNQKEQTEMVMLAADKIDDATLLNKLPWLDVDEVKEVLANRDADSDARFDDEDMEE